MISEDLTLNLGPALQQAAEWERDFLARVANIASTIADSINAGLAQTDASPVGESIEAAVEGADTTAEVQGDASSLPPEIEGQIEAADTTAVVEGDAESLPAVVESALDAADKTVVVEGDVSELGPAVEAELDAADASIVVEADTAGLQDLSSQSREAAGGLGDLAAQSLALKGGTDLLSGATGVLSGSFGGLAAKAGPYGAAIAAVAGATTMYVGGAIEAQAVTERFGRSFGPLAAQVEQIDIGGLNISLGDLAIKLGADDDALRTTASNLATLGQSSGATAKQTAVMSEQVIALASYLSATNPTLGTADQIADRLSSTLARGGRATAGLGLALNAAEIEARALQMTGKATAEELTIYDKAAAGAALATEQLGDRMGAGIEAGAQTGVIQLRSFKTAISETIESLGAPLIGPVLGIVKSLGPVLGQIATTVGLALQTIMPSISRAITLLSPFVTVVLGGINIVLSAVAKAIQLIDNFLGPVYDKIAQVAGFIGGAIGKVLGFIGAIETEAPKAVAAAQATDQFGAATDRAGAQAAETQAQVEALKTKVDEHAQTIVAAMPTVADAFEKASEDSQVSLKELQAALAEQLKVEREWFANLNIIAATGSLALVEELGKMGPARAAAAAKAIAESTPAQAKAINDQILELRGITETGARELGGTLGRGTVIGFKNEIAAINQAFADIKKAAGSIFIARSPSRWAMGLGSDIGTGLAMGIEQTLPRVEAAFGSITNTPMAAGSSSSVTVAPGAVQITFAGGITPAAVPGVEAVVDQAFSRLLQEIGRR